MPDRIFFLAFLLLSINGIAQNSPLQGHVLDTAGAPLPYATVSLLYPEDSTLAYFSMTGESGEYTLRNVKSGNYLFQVAMLGYSTYWKKIELPAQNFDVILKTKSKMLSEVSVEGERIPFLIRGDTISYDAAAYRVKPDGDVESLLKQMPGIQVDQNGNVKAQGEKVNNVLVDGKEFFGSDPKIATKNLPADAVKRVDVYDKKSEESQMTGIKDGQRDKTINLVLKDEKKSAVFGEVSGGYGTEERYKAGAKIFRFNDKIHLAGLGIINNVNQFGFSFKDYMDFNGGLSALMNGDGEARVTVENDESTPVDFGQTIDGLLTNGAAGLNFSFEKVKDNRTSVSYLGNGMDKFLLQNTTRSYTTDAEAGIQSKENLREKDRNFAHRLNFFRKNKIDSTKIFLTSCNVSYNNQSTSDYSNSTTALNDQLINAANGVSTLKANGLKGKLSGSYLKSFQTTLRLLKAFGDFDIQLKNSDNTIQNNIETRVDTGRTAMDYIQEMDNLQISAQAGLQLTFKGKSSFAFDLVSSIGRKVSERKRADRFATIPDETSFEEKLQSAYLFSQSSIAIRSSKEKINWKAGVLFEMGKFQNYYRTSDRVQVNLMKLLPFFQWENSYRSGRRLSVEYYSHINLPQAVELDTILNSNDPIQHFSGNRYLIPETEHSIFTHWMMFDQFSSTSLTLMLNGVYTSNKIQYARSYDLNNILHMTAVNVSKDYRLRAGFEFSRPIPHVPIVAELDGESSWNRGYNIINESFGYYDENVHSLTVRLENRKKKIVDCSLGADMQWHTLSYRFYDALKSNYNKISYFSELQITPGERIAIELNASYSVYTGAVFPNRTGIPLMTGSVSFFSKSKRAIFTLNCFDILNQNKGIETSSDFTSFQERRFNTLNRYFMLTFTWKLNKFTGKDGVDVQIKSRH